MFESEPMHSGISRARTAPTGRKPSPRSASVVGHAQMRAPACGDVVELRVVRVRGMDDRRAWRQAARVRQQLDRAAVVLLEALQDLAWLLVGMNVERQALGGRVASDLLQPVARARAHGVGGDADRDSRRPEGLDIVQVGRNRRLAHPLEATPFVRDVKEHDLDPRLGRSLGGGECLGDAEIVELADGRESGSTHLPVHRHILVRTDAGRCPLRLLEHSVTPRPEVGPRGAPAESALKRVAVGVDETGKREGGAHD